MKTLQYRLFLFGTISILLLSSFSIWRIWLDRQEVNDHLNKYQQLTALTVMMNNIISSVGETRIVCFQIVSENPNEEHVKMLAVVRQRCGKQLGEIQKSLSVGRGDEHQNQWRAISRKIDSLMQLQRRQVIEAVDPISPEFLSREIDPLANEIVRHLEVFKSALVKEATASFSEAELRAGKGDQISILIGVLTFISGAIGLVILRSGMSQNTAGFTLKKN